MFHGNGMVITNGFFSRKLHLLNFSQLSSIIAQSFKGAYKFNLIGPNTENLLVLGALR